MTERLALGTSVGGGCFTVADAAEDLGRRNISGANTTAMIAVTP
jgi:hypothetical protein